MKKHSFLILCCLAVIFFSCSSKKTKMAQVMDMDGSIWEVANPKDVECSKGDSIIMMFYCDHKTNPCQPSIYGFYTGTMKPTDVIWENGQITASYSFEKAIFLKDLKDR